MTENVAAVTDSWNDGRVFDVYTELRTLTAATTAATLFSDSVPPTTLRQALQDITTLVDGIFWRALMPSSLDRIPTPGNRAFQRAGRRLRETLAVIIADRRSGITDHDDLLSAVLNAEAAGGNGFTDAEISDQILTFFAAGTETTASLLAWALHVLDRHPDIASQLHAEVDTVLGGRPAQHSDVARLELTGRIIAETLRMWGSNWLITRVVAEDTELDGYPLSAGATVAYSPYLIHHRPDLHQQPERFDPERWNPARPQPPANAYIPFASGPRKCIGDTFALLEATLALATISARWELHSQPGQNVKIARSGVMHPRQLRMCVTKRTRRQ